MPRVGPPWVLTNPQMIPGYGAAPIAQLRDASGGPAPASILRERADCARQDEKLGWQFQALSVQRMNAGYGAVNPSSEALA